MEAVSSIRFKPVCTQENLRDNDLRSSGVAGVTTGSAGVNKACKRMVSIETSSSYLSMVACSVSSLSSSSIRSISSK